MTARSRAALVVDHGSVILRSTVAPEARTFARLRAGAAAAASQGPPAPI